MKAATGALADAPRSRSREHVEIDRAIADESGVGVGEQVRLYTGAGEFALYTVCNVVSSENRRLIWLGDAGRDRIFAEVGAAITLRTDVSSDLSDDEAAAAGEFVERAIEGTNNDVIALAPHGGEIEKGTDDQALRVAERLKSPAWLCRGWKQGRGAFLRWHITSSDLDARSFPLLAPHLARYRMAIAFHGHSGLELLIGGAAPAELKAKIARAISQATNGEIPLKITAAGDHFAGHDPKNIVNRVTTGGGGVQLEQPLSARQHHAAAIADAVADVLAPPGL